MEYVNAIKASSESIAQFQINALTIAVEMESAKKVNANASKASKITIAANKTAQITALDMECVKIGNANAPKAGKELIAHIKNAIKSA